MPAATGRWQRSRERGSEVQRPVTPPVSRREIRSARFPHGLPDRCDDTVVEAFDDAWLLLEQTPTGYRVLGVAEDYESARAWLIAPEDPTRS
jgi:hypothetical protein